MTLIGDYTNRILTEFMEYSFNAKEHEDLAKAISAHLADFEIEVKQQHPTNIKLHNLRNLKNGI